MASESSKYDHWTEYDPRVLDFLEETFGDEPYKQENGADLIVGGVRVEVKSCNEWNTTKHANGKRRRGRFQIEGYEDCDFFLFVLVKGNEIDMKIVPPDDVIGLGSIRWPVIFN